MGTEHRPDVIDCCTGIAESELSDFLLFAVISEARTGFNEPSL